VNQWFNRQTHQLDMSLSEIELRITKAITMDDLGENLLGRLQDSGRVPLVSLYLWDQGKSAYRLKRQRGRSTSPLMQTIAQKPFTDGFKRFGPVLSTSDLKRRVRRQLPGHEEATARLRTMEAMGAQLTLAIRSGDLVLGWLNLSSVDWFDGFSQDQTRRLAALTDRVAIILENIYSFEEAESQARLAAMGTMAAGLAHEIRNPLAGIKGAAQYLQDTKGSADADEVDEFLDVIVDEADRLNVVVSQFLDYARPFVIHPTSVDVAALIERVVELVKIEDHPPDICIQTKIMTGLPKLNLDPDRIRQVLLNLIHNAIHAVHPVGNIVIRCDIGRSPMSPQYKRPMMEITVTDDGTGIDPKDLKSLFVPFFTTKKQGTGLGLPISQRLIEAHEGHIEVSSRANEGTSFVVSLPLPSQAIGEELEDDAPTESIPLSELANLIDPDVV
jgi:two-component system sensor histidine kinase HydH